MFSIVSLGAPRRPLPLCSMRSGALAGENADAADAAGSLPTPSAQQLLSTICRRCAVEQMRGVRVTPRPTLGDCWGQTGLLDVRDECEQRDSFRYYLYRSKLGQR